MSKIRQALLFLALSSGAIAQTSNVTATITDSDGTTWANGTVQIVFVPTPGIPGPFVWSGGAGFPQKFSTNMNGSGVFTIAIPDNGFISPKGSMWQFTLCSNTSAPCQNITTPVTGPSPNLSSTLNGVLLAPRFGAGQYAFGYADLEVSGPTTGATYFNVTNVVQRIWTGSVWQNNSSGGAGSGVVSPNNGSAGAVAEYLSASGSTTVSPDPNLNDSGSLLNYAGTAGVTVSAGPLSVAAPSGKAGYFNLSGNTSNQSVAPNTKGFMGPNAASFTSWAGQLSQTDPNGSNTLLSCAPPVSNVSACSWTAGGFPVAQIGDIYRFNVNGDSAPDAVSYAQSYIWAYAIQDGMGVSGQYTGGGSFLGSGSNIFPTATYGFKRQLTASASASTSTVVGVLCCTNGNNVLFPFLAHYRTGQGIQISTTTNARWWIGLANYNVGSSCGINSTPILNTTAYAADIPNKTTLGFRFSAGTDTTWTGVSINCGGSPTSTTCSTGISPDTTAQHTYDIIPNSTGTAASFYIDGVFGCTISSNMPNVGLTFDSEAGMFVSGDNKNTATALTLTWSFMKMAVKQ